MTNYILDNYDLSDLFDTNKKSISFSEDPRKHIPEFGSMIYTVWDNNEKFIYVGISGIGQSPNTPLLKRNPRSRIKQHQSGRRSGDQFCVYVHDYFVIPELLKSNSYQPSRGYLDRLTKEYVQKKLRYRFLCFQTEDGVSIVRNLENKIKSGIFDLKPFLNGEE